MNLIKKISLFATLVLCKALVCQESKDTLTVYIAFDARYKSVILEDTLTHSKVKVSRSESKKMIPKQIITKKGHGDLKIYARGRFFGKRKHYKVLSIDNYKTKILYLWIEDREFKFEFIERLRRIK